MQDVSNKLNVSLSQVASTIVSAANTCCCIHAAAVTITIVVIVAVTVAVAVT